MPKKHSTLVQERLLTEVELELMNIIWALQKATVKEVSTNIAKERKLAYTTVATVIKVLEQKGFLSCQKDSFAHVFTPLISKEEYENTSIEHMVTHVFDGKPITLLQRLLEAKTFRADEIKAIELALQQLTPASE